MMSTNNYNNSASSLKLYQSDHIAPNGAHSMTSKYLNPELESGCSSGARQASEDIRLRL